LVELFNKRNFVCDCGTTRLPSPCTLREDPKTGRKGVQSQEAAPGNKYNHNFRNQFCGCGEQYDAHQEKGTMFQCLGLGTVETGGCGEDWWHPECLIGLPRDWHKSIKKPVPFGGDGAGDAPVDDDEETPLPPGFPAEDDFWQLICFKCLNSNPWLKPYAGTPGFLPPVYQNGGMKKSTGEEGKKLEEQSDKSKKRKAEDDDDETSQEPTAKRTKDETQTSTLAPIKEEPSTKSEEVTDAPEADAPKAGSTQPKHTSLPVSVPAESFSLFVEQDFHDRLCHCAECFPKLAPHPQLREEEDTYEPPLSDDGEANAAASTGTGSLLERGEAALSNVDRVRAIEGAMIYNHLRDKVKDFLKPFAESGQAVSADDIKGYFEKLRGDEQGIKDAAGQAEAMGGSGGDGDAGDSRREQNGMSRCLD
jgi:E3 ubiquitin-protein ligase UBR7